MSQTAHVIQPDASPAAWQAADAHGRREMIVKASLDLLHAEGLSAVTMRAVAASLGVGTMTLYTYIEGQHGLHREMVRRGFEMLHGLCKHKNDPTHKPTKEDWIDGAKTYLAFARENPNLYKLMFDHPMGAEDDLLRGGFEPYLERVSARLAAEGMVCMEDLPREARRRAGRIWITLHGLAMLTIAGRFKVLESDLDDVLDDLVPRIYPA